MNKEQAKEYIKANPDIYFQTFGLAKDGGYICPLCQNGAGKDGTGIREIPTKKGVYKCFKCEFSGDVLSFIAKENNLDIKSDFQKVMDIACSIYGIALDNASVKKNASFRSKRQTPLKSQNQQERTTEGATDAPQTDYTDFFNEAHKHLNESDYLTKRGISEETQNKFNIGYCKEWKHPKRPNMTPSERIIIPTSKHSYIARAPNEDKEQYKAMKVGKVHIFNVKALEEDSQDPTFICEGEIDALSIVEAGGQAIGLGGTSNIPLLINELEKNREAIRKRPYIICLDNDAAGKEAFTKLQNEMKIKGFSLMDKCEELIETYKDPNDALVADKDRFKEKVAAAKAQVAEMLKEEKENYIQEYKEKLADVFTSFYKKKKTIETGLTELDKFLDGGLHAGLYVLAAASGAGKTTFALQIADHIAKNKQGVLFFSGEVNCYGLTSVA